MLQNRQEIYFVKGALEKILPQCNKYSANGQVYSLNQKKDEEFLTEAYDIGQQGLRGTYLLISFITCKFHCFWLYIYIFK